jgi:hypothetical protein
MAGSVISTPWCTSYFSCRPRRMAMVASTLGSSTSTFWKRRSSAASFSTYLRYSFSVVAPMQCSSPRASAGLSMLPASIAPSALPAPTMVCNSSMNRMMRPSSGPLPSARPSAALRIHRGTWHRPAGRPCPAPAPSCSSGCRAPRRHDALRQALDDGGLAHAGLADQHRVVLAAALQHLDGTADLVVAADHRVQLALPCALGQVERVLLQRFTLAFGSRRCPPSGRRARR